MPRRKKVPVISLAVRPPVEPYDYATASGVDLSRVYAKCSGFKNSVLRDWIHKLSVQALGGNSDIRDEAMRRIAFIEENFITGDEVVVDLPTRFSPTGILLNEFLGIDMSVEHHLPEVVPVAVFDTVTETLPLQ